MVQQPEGGAERAASPLGLLYPLKGVRMQYRGNRLLDFPWDCCYVPPLLLRNPKGCVAVMGVRCPPKEGSLPLGLLTIFLPPSGVRLQGDGNGEKMVCGNAKKKSNAGTTTKPFGGIGCSDYIKGTYW